jgi:hypothetical protein
VLLPADQVVPGLQERSDTEFVRELILAPPTMAQAASGAVEVKATNPDEQSAEM